MSTRTVIDKLTALSPQSPKGRIRLTNHMYSAWHRFDMKRRFHLNSDKNRIEFIIWYFIDFMPDRHFALEYTATGCLAGLVEPVQSYGPLNVFLHALWRERFSSNEAYNIYTEDGYSRFSAELLNAKYYRSISFLLPPGLILSAQRPVMGNDKGGISAAIRSLWLSSEMYQEKYDDLSDRMTAEAFNFDIIIHKIARDDVVELFHPAMKQFWSAPAFGSYPALSRFIAALAMHAPRFAKLLRSEGCLYDQRQQIVDWFWSQVVPAFPHFAQLAIPPARLTIDVGAKANARSRASEIMKMYGIKHYPGEADADIDVLLIGPYGAGSGLGTGTRRSVGALRRAGCNFKVLDIMYDNPAVGLEQLPADLIFKGETPSLTLWHFNAEYLPEVVKTFERFINPHKNIAYYFWETEAMPDAHILGADIVDEIWVPSEFVKKCYSGSDVPVINVGTSVELPEIGRYLNRSYFGLGTEFVFMFSFDSHSVIHRKNPAATVRAFRAAFPFQDDVRLVIKTQNLYTAHWAAINGRGEELEELCSMDPRIIVINDTMSLHELYSLKNAIDCYISLHRSEGFGYGPAEAMALGKPTIMTNYSANTEFGDDGASLLVDAQLVHVLDGEYLYWTPEMMWADPDFEVAAEYMRKIYDDRDFAMKLGFRGKKRIESEFSIESTAQRYKARLTELGII